MDFERNLVELLGNRNAGLKLFSPFTFSTPGFGPTDRPSRGGVSRWLRLVALYPLVHSPLTRRAVLGDLSRIIKITKLGTGG